jgi:hypothetical protein
MAKPVFKSYPQGQTVLFPASLDEKLSEDSPACLINHVTDSLDISRVYRYLSRRWDKFEGVSQVQNLQFYPSHNTL